MILLCGGGTIIIGICPSTHPRFCPGCCWHSRISSSFRSFIVLQCSFWTFNFKFIDNVDNDVTIIIATVSVSVCQPFKNVISLMIEKKSNDQKILFLFSQCKPLRVSLISASIETSKLSESSSLSFWFFRKESSMTFWIDSNSSLFKFKFLASFATTMSKIIAQNLNIFFFFGCNNFNIICSNWNIFDTTSVFNRVKNSN